MKNTTTINISKRMCPEKCFSLSLILVTHAYHQHQLTAPGRTTPPRKAHHRQTLRFWMAAAWESQKLHGKVWHLICTQIWAIRKLSMNMLWCIKKTYTFNNFTWGEPSAWQWTNSYKKQICKRDLLWGPNTFVPSATKTRKPWPLTVIWFKERWYKSQ